MEFGFQTSHTNLKPNSTFRRKVFPLCRSLGVSKMINFCQLCQWLIDWPSHLNMIEACDKSDPLRNGAFWQEAHPLQFESREDEQHFPMVVVGRRPDPYIRFLTNSPSLAVHHPKQLYQRTGFRYSHRLRARPTLFQISRMVGGRKKEITWSDGAGAGRMGG